MIAGMKEILNIQKYFIGMLVLLQLIGCGNGNFENPTLPSPASNEVNTPSDDNAVQDNPKEKTPDKNDSQDQTSPEQYGFSLKSEVKYYDLRYELDSLTQKLTDNKGAGAEEFYGTRNFRVVLPGVFYRGGGNNKYLNPPRSNVNPLPTVGLKNLCEENFSTAVYLYAENFSKAPRSVTCKNSQHQTNTLQYKQHAAAGENERIIELVYKRIKGKLKGPIYAHCWNGWHSSGLISGMVLKQFCGWSNAQADAYWVKNTDGHSAGFDKIRAKLRAFKPYAKYSITREERTTICPKL